MLAIDRKPELKPIGPHVLDQAPASQPREYSGFPFWRVLLGEPNREQKSADVLYRFGMLCYLPTFVKQSQRRGQVLVRRPRLHAVMPGLIFVPDEHLDIPDRNDVFKWAHVHGFMRGTAGIPALLMKDDIQIIREIEAKLNLPPERKGVLFTMGQEVRFTNEVYAAFWGTGKIFEVASETRIGVEVKKLFGRPTKVYVPASEIEAM